MITECTVEFADGSATDVVRVNIKDSGWVAVNADNNGWVYYPPRKVERIVSRND